MDTEVIQQFAIYFAGLISLALLVEFARALIWGSVFYFVFKSALRVLKGRK